MIIGRFRDFNIYLIMSSFNFIAFIGCAAVNYQSLHSIGLFVPLF